MKVRPIVTGASIACLLSVSCHAAADLTRAEAKKAFEKVAAADTPTTTLTLSTSQMERLKSIPPDPPPQASTQPAQPAQKKHGFLSKLGKVVTVNDAHAPAGAPANAALSKVFKLVYAPPQGPYSFADPTNHPALFVDGGRWCLPDSSDMRIMTGNFVQCENYVGLDISWQRPGILMQLKNPIKWTVTEVTGITEGSTASEKVVDVTWQFDLSSFPQNFQDAIQQPPLKGKILFKLYVECRCIRVHQLLFIALV